MRRYSRYAMLALSIGFLVTLTQMRFGPAFHAMIIFVACIVGALGALAGVLFVLKRRRDV